MTKLFLLCAFFTHLLYADIIMGVVPQQSPLELLKNWAPIAEYLSQQTGQKILFKTEKSIDTFESVLYGGGYDFAYMNPLHYVLAHQKEGYDAQVRATKNIQGILVAKAGTTPEVIQDKQSIFLFPAPNAFAATVLMQYDLMTQFGVDPSVIKNARYVNSHDSVYKGVERGIGTVGGGIMRTFKSIDPSIKERLVIIHTTKMYPSHPFAFKPTMPAQTKEAIVNALLQMPQSLLEPLKIDKLKKIEHSEYESVEAVMKKIDYKER